MFPIERQEHILEFINSVEKADTEQLAMEFGISKVTVRRDLEVLANKGLITKMHGGAISVSNSLLSYEIPYSLKSAVNTGAKRKIGLAASAMIAEGDIIILDAGSTTLEVAKNINNRSITALTNDIKIAFELTRKKNVHTIVPGGNLVNSVYTLTGIQTIDFYRKVHVNKSFLGCDALDAEFGITNRTAEEVPIKQAIINAADEVIMVTDSSKLNKRVFQFMCDASAIHKLIVEQIDSKTKDALQSKGVEVIIA